MFPTTDWSLVEHCRDDVPDRRARHEQLVAIYLPALRAYLRGAKGCAAEEADELVQAFAAAKLVGPSVVSKARRGRGRFRSYLLTIFQNYLTDERRRAEARERGRERYHAASCAAVGSDGVDPFDLVWARAVLNDAAQRMQRHLLETHRAALWRVFESRVLLPSLQQADPPPYEQMVREYGFATPTQACSAVVTARRMFARFLREVVAEYTDGDDSAIEDELIDLRRIVAAAR